MSLSEIFKSIHTEKLPNGGLTLQAEVDPRIRVYMLTHATDIAARLIAEEFVKQYGNEIIKGMDIEAITKTAAIYAARDIVGGMK